MTLLLLLQQIKLSLTIELHRSVNRSVLMMMMMMMTDLGEGRGCERSQLAAAPPEGVVSVRGAHVEQALPLGRLAEHAQLPVLILAHRYLNTGRRGGATLKKMLCPISSHRM